MGIVKKWLSQYEPKRTTSAHDISCHIQSKNYNSTSKTTEKPVKQKQEDEYKLPRLWDVLDEIEAKQRRSNRC